MRVWLVLKEAAPRIISTQGCTDNVINSLIIMTILIYKIPPNLPLPKGGFSPLFGKEGCGEIFWINVNSIMRPLITYTGTGEIFHIFSAYSRIALSLENLPERATLSMAILVQRSSSL